MILKCTKGQFEALNRLFEVIMNERPIDIPSSLARDLMEPIHRKINNRLTVKLQGNKSWNLSLTPLQAKSYYTFFHEMNLSNDWMYEQIIIRRHLDEINRIYA